MIVLIIDAQVSEANRARFVELALRHAEASRKDEGCLAFDILRDASNPGVVRFYEEWGAMADLEAHRDTPHAAFFRENGRPLAESMSVRKLEASETG